MTHPDKDRMQDIEGVVNALRSGMEDDAANRGQRELVVGGILIALVAIVGWLWTTSDGGSSPAAARPLSLVVQTTENAETNGWIGQALRASLVAQLEAGGDIRVANNHRQQLRIAASAAPFALSEPSLGSIDSDLWRLSFSVVATAEVDDLLQLSYTLAGPGKELQSGQLVGRTGMLSDLASRTGIEVRSLLKLPLPGSPNVRAAAALLPNDVQAQELWISGMQALASNRFASAVELLTTALEREPNHPMIEQGLAQAYGGLGYEELARQHASAAVESSEGLAREQQLNIRADKHALNKEWEKASELLRALHLPYPQDIGYGLRLAETQVTAGQFDAADETLEQLRALSDRQAEDPRIDLLAANSAYARGDWSAGLKHAERALGKAQSDNNADLEALALWWMNRLDADPDELLIARAELLFERVGNTDGQIASITRRGTRARARGDLLQASGYYDSAIGLARDTGNESRLSTALGTLAIVKDLQGDLRGGLELKEEVLHIRRRRGNQTGIGVSLENLGISHYKMGNLAAASARFDEANDQFVRANDQIGEAWAPWHQGRLLLRYGKTGAALTLFESAAENAREKPEGSYNLHAEFELLQMRLFMQPTESQVDDTIAEVAALRASYTDAQLFPDAAEALLLQSRFEYLAGETGTAIAHATEAYNVFVSEGAAYYRLKAVTQLLRFGEIDRCDEVLELSGKSQHRYLALLGLAAASNCPETATATMLAAIKQESAALGLFEPLWLATHQQDPAAARALAAKNSWQLAP